MPSLRTLLSDQAPPTIGNPNKIFYVQNFSDGADSGGCCCLWTVPAGATRVTFEMWGSGGIGQGARCCEAAGTVPTSGSYAKVTVDTVEGCQYRICSGGSSSCNGCCGISSRANPSYVYDVTAASVIGCALGGDGGCSEMKRDAWCYGYICCWGRLSGTGLGDVVMDGTGGIAYHNCYCRNEIMTINGGGFQSERQTASWCAKDGAGSGVYFMCSPPSRPGGAGSPGRACSDGRCYGQHGAAGFVKISYT
jgi:hypothetical protein